MIKYVLFKLDDHIEINIIGEIRMAGKAQNNCKC
jgi:hypothetical protein